MTGICLGFLPVDTTHETCCQSFRCESGVALQVVPEPVDKWQDVGVGHHNVLQAFYDNQERFAYTFQNYVFVTRMMQVCCLNTPAYTSVHLFTKCCGVCMHVCFAALCQIYWTSDSTVGTPVSMHGSALIPLLCLAASFSANLLRYHELDMLITSHDTPPALPSAVAGEGNTTG